MAASMICIMPSDWMIGTKKQLPCRKAIKVSRFLEIRFAKSGDGHNPDKLNFLWFIDSPLYWL